VSCGAACIAVPTSVCGLEGCAPGCVGEGWEDRTGERSRGVERKGVGEGVGVSAAVQCRRRDLSLSFSLHSALEIE
jgi:hypothetical protein